jgi:hypothetical protein
VSVIRRRWLVPVRNRRERQDRALASLGERRRVRRRVEDDGVQIDFPKSLGRRAAKEQIVAELAEIEPAWRRLFVVYPRESNIRDGS